MSALAGVAGVQAALPFPRMTWDVAMERYGSDRPDLRWSLELSDWTRALGDVDFRILREAVQAGGRIRGLLLEGGAALSRKQIEGIEGAAKAAGARVVIVNAGPTDMDPIADAVLRGPISEILPRLVGDA